MKQPFTKRFFARVGLVVLVVLSGLAAWNALRSDRGVTEQEACKKKCHPLPWQLKGEKRLPNAPEGWRNYPTNPKCICG